MTEPEQINLWSSKKTGLIIYPAIIIFIILTITAGNLIRLQPLDTDPNSSNESMSFWSTLKSELMK